MWLGIKLESTKWGWDLQKINKVGSWSHIEWTKMLHLHLSPQSSGATRQASVTRTHVHANKMDFSVYWHVVTVKEQLAWICKVMIPVTMMSEYSSYPCDLLKSMDTSGKTRGTLFQVLHHKFMIPTLLQCWSMGYSYHRLPSNFWLDSSEANFGVHMDQNGMIMIWSGKFAYEWASPINNWLKL